MRCRERRGSSALSVVLRWLPGVAWATCHSASLRRSMRERSVADDVTVTVDYSYRNNGRGPDLKEEFALAEDGTLVRYLGNGKSTYRAPISDSFTRQNERAEWKSLLTTLRSLPDRRRVRQLPVMTSPGQFAKPRSDGCDA